MRCDHLTVVVVLNVRGGIVGAVADGVSDVLELAADDVKAAPEFNGRVPSAHILGIAPLRHDDGQRMLILTDIEALMAEADMGLFAEAA
ncbi:MAG: chemotaxis protein CheW [Pseudomonadota bacterium]